MRFRPFDAAFLEDPYPSYAALRRESPVARIRIGPVTAARLLWRFAAARRSAGGPGVLRSLARARRERRAYQAQLLARIQGKPGRTRFYAVSRYDDVTRVLRDPETFSSVVMGGSEARALSDEGDIAPTSGSLIGLDPPEHGRHRGIVNRGFTPRRIAALEPRIRKIADELVGAFEGRSEVELMEAFANPLPVAVIAELLGLDPARRDDFKRWSTALIIGSTQPGAAGGARLDLFREFRSYMTEVTEARRRDPRDDLISLLVHAEEEDGILDTEQVVSFASLLLAAGSETTTNLVGNAILALLAHPEELERARAHPELLPAVVEEALRYDSPVQLLMRLATREVEVAGQRIGPGSLVTVLLGSANRDPAQFPDPDRFVAERDTRGHLALGLGNHFCLGASLARLEGRIALETLLTRLPHFALAEARIERHGSFLVRGPRALPLRLS